MIQYLVLLGKSLVENPLMKLLIDMGNSAIKWASLKQKRLSTQKAIPYQGDRLDNLLTQAWLKLEVPSQGIWVSNVAGAQKAEILSHWIKTHWGLKPTFIKTSRYSISENRSPRFILAVPR